MEQKPAWPAPRNKMTLKTRVFKVILEMRLQNIQPLPSGLPLSNPRKAKIQTIGQNNLAENVPNEHDKATWKGLTLPTNALPGNPFYSSILEENFRIQAPRFYSQMKVSHPPNAMFPSWSQHPHTFKQCATSLGSRTCSSLIHNGSRHPCTLFAPPQKGFHLLPKKIPFADGHLLFLPPPFAFSLRPCAIFPWRYLSE